MRKRKTTPMITHFSRWGVWEQEILSRVESPVACQKIIGQRQRAVDDDECERELVREYISKEIRRRFDVRADVCCAFISVQTITRLVNEALSERYSIPQVTRYLKALGIPELNQFRRADRRGWRWKGKKCKDAAKMLQL